METSTIHQADGGRDSLSPCPAGREPTLPPCTLDEFKCTNGHCVALPYVCDHNDNCGDRTDELGCSEYHDDTMSSLNVSLDSVIKCCCLT